MARGIRPLIAVAVAGALAFTACGDDSDDSAQGADEGSAEQSTDAAGGGEAAAGEEPVQAISQQTEGQERQVIYTADLVVRVTDVEEATTQAVGLTDDAGGLLFEQRSDLQGEREATLVLKVPPDELDSVLDSLSDLGRLISRDVAAQDVTDQVVDLDARLASAEASAARLRGLLADAPSTTALVEIEAELARREAEIESMQGQLRVLTSQVEMATINVRLTERADLEVSDDLPGFLNGLEAGWVILVTAALLLVLAIGFLLPLTPVAALSWWLVRKYQRMQRIRRQQSVIPQPPPH